MPKPNLPGTSAIWEDAGNELIRIPVEGGWLYRLRDSTVLTFVPAPQKASTTRVVDNDRDEITVTLDGVEIRGWSYANDAERRTKIQLAHEYAEGWFQATQHLRA